LKTVYILNNIGTPKAPTPEEVGPYLTEFLTDPDVIPLPAILRHILVRGIIVPRRSKTSAAKYQLIWTEQGSPLLINSLNLQNELQKNLIGEVLLGMQFGQPSLISAFERAVALGAEKVVLVPLYPQYAEATTGGAIRKAKQMAEKAGFKGVISAFPSFPTEDFFLEPLKKLIASRKKEGDFVLFTFHGLPENQVKKGAPGCLVEKNCCDRSAEITSKCYRAQSFATARKLAEKLHLEKHQWRVSFQSRLGRAKWIQPYTDDVLLELAAEGKTSIVVVSPSFVSDCLETLEELGHEGKSTFLSAGGKRYELVPCVNSDAEFAKGFATELAKM
jgi:protoporphyrin/coproporphyrin ferrochelatase